MSGRVGPDGSWIPDTSRADNLMARLEMNAMHDARRGTVMPPQPTAAPIESAQDPDPFIPGTQIRFSELRAMQEAQNMKNAMAQQQQLLGSAGALAPASAPMPVPATYKPAPSAAPTLSAPGGFLSIDLLTWEVVADNGQRFPILTQDEARSVLAFCYNIYMRDLNMRTQQLREAMGLPEPTLPASTGIPQRPQPRQVQQQEAVSGAGNEGVSSLPRPKAARKVRQGKARTEAAAENM